MFILIIFVIIVVVTIAALTTNNSGRNLGDNSDFLNNIGKTEMMSDMYKDITGNNLDPIEKSILFKHNSKKK